MSTDFSPPPPRGSGPIGANGGSNAHLQRDRLALWGDVVLDDDGDVQGFLQDLSVDGGVENDLLAEADHLRSCQQCADSRAALMTALSSAFSVATPAAEPSLRRVHIDRALQELAPTQSVLQGIQERETNPRRSSRRRWFRDRFSSLRGGRSSGPVWGQSGHGGGLTLRPVWVGAGLAAVALVAVVSGQRLTRSSFDATASRFATEAAATEAGAAPEAVATEAAAAPEAAVEAAAAVTDLTEGAVTFNEEATSTSTSTSTAPTTTSTSAAAAVVTSDAAATKASTAQAARTQDTAAAAVPVVPAPAATAKQDQGSADSAIATTKPTAIDLTPAGDAALEVATTTVPEGKPAAARTKKSTRKKAAASPQPTVRAAAPGPQTATAVPSAAAPASASAAASRPNDLGDLGSVASIDQATSALAAAASRVGILIPPPSTNTSAEPANTTLPSPPSSAPNDPSGAAVPLVSTAPPSTAPPSTAPTAGIGSANGCWSSLPHVAFARLRIGNQNLIGLVRTTSGGLAIVFLDAITCASFSNANGN